MPHTPQKHSPTKGTGVIAAHTGTLRAFALGIQKGDIVLTPTANQSEVLVGRVTSDYQFAPEPIVAHFQHNRSVDWVGRVPRTRLPETTRGSLNAPRTVYKVGGANELHAMFPPKAVDDPLASPKWTNAWWVNQGATFEKEKAGSYMWAPTTARDGGPPPKNSQALTGMQVGDLIFNYARGFIQAVSRVSAPAEVTDRPAELPSTESEGPGWKVASRHYLLDEPIALNEIPQEWRRTEKGPFDVNGEVKQQYASHLSEHFTQLMIDRFGARLRNVASGPSPDPGADQVDPSLIDLIRRRMNVVFYGPPGTGKTYVALKLARQWEQAQGPYTVRKVTFHPSYGYEDFVQGFRPKEDQPGHFALQPGILLRICDDARKDPERDFLLVIDEINRGDVARVFGELITYIERDKRGETFDLAQDPTARYEIPPNLYFLGTMNTADKSVSLLDVALRRRFAFVEFGPKADIYIEVPDWQTNVERIDIGELLSALNERLLAEGIEVDRAIGHALLGIPANAPNPLAILRERLEFDIAPLVAEYSYLDRARIGRILPGLVDDHGRFRQGLSDGELMATLRSLIASARPSEVPPTSEPLPLEPQVEAEAMQTELNE